MDYTPKHSADNKGPVMQNSILVFGQVHTLPVFHHEVMGEKFFQFQLSVPRLSQSMDVLPVMVSQRMLDEQPMELGKTLGVTGQIRSYKRVSEGTGHLLLTIFARQWAEGMASPGQNQVALTGRLTRPPSYRSTPFGREITDMLIEVPRAYDKTDLIPCIAWGKFARSCSGFEAGARVTLSGRLQSRVYQKRLEEEVVDKVTYEVSVHAIHQIV